MEGVGGVGTAFVGVQGWCFEVAYAEVGDLCLRWLDLVEDCDAVLGRIIRSDIFGLAEAAQDDGCQAQSEQAPRHLEEVYILIAVEFCERFLKCLKDTEVERSMTNECEDLWDLQVVEWYMVSVF